MLNSIKTWFRLFGESAELKEAMKNAIAVYDDHTKIERDCVIPFQPYNFESEYLSGISRIGAKHDVWEGDLFKTLAKTSGVVGKGSNKVLDAIETKFKHVNNKANFDYYHLNLLRYVESVEWYNSYILALIDVLSTECLSESNTNHITKNKGMAVKSKYVTDHASAFFIIAGSLSKPIDDTLMKMANLDGRMYDEDDWEGNNPLSTRLDVTTAKFVPVGLNPFYFIGGIYQMQTESYNQYRSELLDATRVKVQLHQKELSGDLSDAERVKLEKILKYKLNLINKIEGQLDSQEFSYNRGGDS